MGKLFAIQEEAKTDLKKKLRYARSYSYDKANMRSGRERYTYIKYKIKGFIGMQNASDKERRHVKILDKRQVSPVLIENIRSLYQDRGVTYD